MPAPHSRPDGTRLEQHQARRCTVTMKGALIAFGIVLAAVTADARPATVSDFAICNREATEVTGGSALPGPAERTPRSAPPMTPAPGAGGMASGTDSTGKIVAGSKDVLLEGMAADRIADAAYHSAYRECMTRRGVTARPAP